MSIGRREILAGGAGGLALALMAAVLGLFGHGPLSETASASADGALTVRHQRFERYQAPSEYDIGALPALAAGGVLGETVANTSDGSLASRA